MSTTPVVDTTGSTLYVVSKVSIPATGGFAQYLFALDLKTGAPKFGSPVLINPTFAGSSFDSNNSIVPLNPLREHLRAAMALFSTTASSIWPTLPTATTRPTTANYWATTPRPFS